MFQRRSVWIILKVKMEEERWRGAMKRDEEFEKPLDVRKVFFKRLTWQTETAGETLTDTEIETEARQQRNRKRQIDGEKQEKNKKRKPKTQHKKGRRPLVLICPGVWTDVERDEDGGIHASDGAPSLGPLCAPVRQSKHTLCQRTAY